MIISDNIRLANISKYNSDHIPDNIRLVNISKYRVMAQRSSRLSTRASSRGNSSRGTTPAWTSTSQRTGDDYDIEYLDLIMVLILDINKPKNR